ncbi:MAG: hypothetical protein NC310_03965 [Roseburia sp.]|nr:hypothetical protein [Roseburia sp.]
MKAKKLLGTLLLSAALIGGLASCGETKKPDDATSKDDLSKKVELKFNLAYGKAEQTLTYNNTTPLELPDGTTVSSGQLKPMWQKVASELNSTFKDVTIQDQKASDMLKTASANGFADATIFGGNSIATSLMSFGTDGKFVNLTKMMEDGEMPHLKQYLDDNPAIKAYITNYDGNIYHVPYIAEIGTFSRAYTMRETWVTKLLDVADTVNYDTGNAFSVSYEGFWTGDKARSGDNGGTVTPKTGVTVKKNTNENIITLMNALPTKDGKAFAECLKSYIKRNYDYTNPSELYLGAKAAYDIDELVALFRVIKANPVYLTDGKANVVYPFFTRQSSYREDVLRFATYFDGVKVHGSDTYAARWYIDNNGDVQFTYSQKEFYDVLTYLSQLVSEGMFYNDLFDTTNKANHRSALYGSDNSDKPSYGFMTFDFTASTTAESLNSANGNDVVGVLPPVSRVNGKWQYYIDNSRVIKPDGWAISAAASDAEIYRACTLFDYFFTEEGALLQNYGLDYMLEKDATFTGPDGIAVPKYNSWTLETANSRAKGDLSSFLRNWMGCLMPIGYQKEIGFEYQYTSQRGFDAWKLMQESTTNIPTYGGKGIEGTNKNYYTLVPPAFSLTKKQSETLSTDTTIEADDFTQLIFNIVLYKTAGNAPSGATVLTTWANYEAELKQRGLEVYVRTYQAAYKAMKG